MIYVVCSLIRVEGMISMICDMQRGPGRWISMGGSWHNWWSAVRQADASPPDGSNRISINEISLFCNIKYQLVCFWLFGICDPFHICGRTCDLSVSCGVCKPKWDMFLVFCVARIHQSFRHAAMRYGERLKMAQSETFIFSLMVLNPSKYQCLQFSCEGLLYSMSTEQPEGCPSLPKTFLHCFFFQLPALLSLFNCNQGVHTEYRIGWTVKSVSCPKICTHQ